NHHVGSVRLVVTKLRRDPRLRRDHLQPQHEQVLMDIITIIIDVKAGAIGGNATGAAAKQYSLGPAGNTIAGVIGGVISGWIVAKLFGGAAPPADAAAAAGFFRPSSAYQITGLQ